MLNRFLKRRGLMKCFVASSIALSLAISASSHAATLKSMPNILVVLVDDIPEGLKQLADHASM